MLHAGSFDVGVVGDVVIKYSATILESDTSKCVTGTTNEFITIVGTLKFVMVTIVEVAAVVEV